MNIGNFINAVKFDLQKAFKEKWIDETYFNTSKESTKKSLSHSRVLGILSFAIQSTCNARVAHEYRLMNGMQVDISVYSKSKSKYKIESVIEYESTNSFLCLRWKEKGKDKTSHILKDLDHYFQVLSSLDIPEVDVPRNWIIITTLPQHGVDKRQWKYLNDLKDKKDDFIENPYNCMYEIYRNAFAALLEKYKKKAENPRKINLIFLNISLEKNNKEIKIKRENFLFFK